MVARNRNSASEVLSKYPSHYSGLAFQKFIFSGELCFINVRSKSLDTKPVLFLWSLDRNAFISSLFPIPGEDAFSLDRVDPLTHIREYYRLSLQSGEVKVEKLAARI